MSTIISHTKMGMFGDKSQALQNKTISSKNVNESASKRISEMKRMINGQTKQNLTKPQSIIDSTKSYGETLKANREKSSNTANQVKKLRYNFKNISSQLARSKTSLNAKQIAGKARREVVKLKQKLQTGQYEEEELQAAISHAESVERIAKKKARHLQEEEMIKITKEADSNDNPMELEEKIEEQEKLENQEEEESEIELEEFQEMTEEAVEESEEEIYDELAGAMEEMVEEALGELSDSMMVITDFEMDEHEFKAYKLKHRQNEDKDLIEADTKYLKAIFDKLEKSVDTGETADISAQMTQSVSQDAGYFGGYINVSL